MDLKNKTIAFLGDSITKGIGASNEDNMYVNVFADMTGAKVFNYGISGTRFAKQIRPSEVPSYDQDFILRVPMMEKDIDAVVVFGGTNDFGHGDAPFGEITDENLSTFCGACDYLMKILIEKYPSKPIIFMTPLHRLTEEHLVNEIGLPRKALKDYVDIIRQKAEKYSIPVLDLYAKSGMQPNVEVQNKLYFADGLHPNDMGHKRIAYLLKQFLKNI